MLNKEDYLARMQVAISQSHHCGAIHRETVPVHEVFNGQTVWQGEVEVFELINHPLALRAYVWSRLDKPDDSEERFVIVLEIPPVTGPITAVRASILADGKKRR